MSTQTIAELKLEAARQAKLIRGLLHSLYSVDDPSAVDPELQRRLSGEEEKLREIEGRLVESLGKQGENKPVPAVHGRLLGPKTTLLRVESTLQMHPIPTGVYHLLDPETDPLLTVKVENADRTIRRVCIRASIEGLSAQAVRTVEIEPRSEVVRKLLPTLLPEPARAITEIQRATLHVIVEDLDGKPECHDTITVTCLARNSGLNSVRRPETGEVVDLTHYYGAWVTPHVEPVQRLVRRAADLLPDRQIWGYQRDPDSVTRQVEALYRALKEAEIAYVNSVIDFGAPPGQASQRTRLPRESILGRAANCIDGAVLFASLLEGASLSPAIVLVPGHAFVGWEAWDGSDDWRFLETTMIGTHDFETACRSGQKQHDDHLEYNADRLKIHRLVDLRSRGIWPME